MAMMILPMMMSCKPVNPVDDPKDPQQDTLPTPQEQLEDWTTGADSLKVPASVDALVGIWRYAFRSEKYKDSVRVNNWKIYEEPDGGPIQNIYWELKKDMTIVVYDFYLADSVPVVNISKGKWSLKDSKYFILDWGQVVNEKPALDQYTVEYVEADRFVISYIISGNENMPEDRIWCDGYQRVAQLPALPENPSDRLTAQPWKVVSDTMWTFTYKTVEIRPDEFVGVTDMKEKKANQVVTNGTFTFKEDGVFTIMNDKGEKIGLYEWKEDVTSSNAQFKIIDLTPVKNDLKLYGSLVFRPNLKDPSKGCFTMNFFDENGNELYYQYMFIVEAVK